MSELPIDKLDEVVAGLRFDNAGLLPAVVQDDRDGTVLMVGWMDAEAVRRTLTTGRTWFWSRSRQEHWRKGDTSGHVQLVRSAAVDATTPPRVIRGERVGPACHTGARSCFFPPLPAVTPAREEQGERRR